MQIGIKGHRGVIEVDASKNIYYKKLGFGEGIYTTLGNIDGCHILGITTGIINNKENIFILTNKNVRIYDTITKHTSILEYPIVNKTVSFSDNFTLHKKVRFQPIFMIDPTESDIYPYYFACVDDKGVNVMYGCHGFVIEYNYIQQIYNKDCYYFKDYLQFCGELEFKTYISKKSFYDYDIDCIIGILNNRKVVVRFDNKKTKNTIYRSKTIPLEVFNKLQHWGWWLIKSKENEFELYIIYTYEDLDFVQKINIDI